MPGTGGPSSTRQLFPKSDLLPGDVLLSCGTEALSELIRRLDGGLYSHAAIWNGKLAVDATGHGVECRELERDEKEQWFIDAYRWHAALPGADPDLGVPPYLSDPVLARTNEIVADKTLFAYDQLLLAGLVIWLSSRPSDRWLRIAARLLLSRFQVWLIERVRNQGKKEMVCSEIVARSFDEATSPPDYSIKVIIDGSRDADAIEGAVGADRAAAAGNAPQVDTSVTSYDSLKTKYGELIVAGMTDDEKRRLLDYANAVANTDANRPSAMSTGDMGLPPSCVTPHDLERSPNLRKLGRLSLNKSPNLPKSTRALFLLLLKDYLVEKVKQRFL